MARNTAVRVALGRAVVGAASVVAPGVVERLIVNRFFTPRRTGQAAAAPLGEEWKIRSGDEEIAVYSAGAAPRVLLVHGWESTAEDFSTMAQAFQRVGYGIVAFDQPAHGRSSGRQTTLPAMSRAVLDVARAAGPFEAVVGHSLGGSATLLALSNGLATRCAALIAPPYDERPFVHQLGAYIGATRGRIEGAIRRIERGADAVSAREADRAAGRIGVPGLVFHDRSDRAVPFSHGVSVAAAWPGARFIPLDGLGHRRVLDAPTVHAEILTFIRQSTATPSSRASDRARRMVPAWEASP
jgi:pimeloyl-ACP methyl ester carboxylesterase